MGLYFELMTLWPSRLLLPLLGWNFTQSLVLILAFLFYFGISFPIGFYGMAMYISPSQADDLKKPSCQCHYKSIPRTTNWVNTVMICLCQWVMSKSQNMVNAFLAAEDSSFFSTVVSVLKALGAYWPKRWARIARPGGSTITQQVAKNYFLSSERTLNRKLTELF